MRMRVDLRRLLDLSIRRKLMLAGGAFGVITGAVGGIGVLGMTTVNGAYQTLARETLPAVSHLEQADRDMQRAAVAERTLMFMTNDSLAAQEQRDVHARSVAQAAEHWRAYTALPASDAERERWREFDEARREWEIMTREVVGLLAQESVESRKDARDVSLKEVTARFEVARKELASIADLRRGLVSEQADIESRQLARLRWIVGLGVLIALGLSVGLATIFARTIARPLDEVVARLKDVAEGEGDLTKRLAVTSADELGELARWFNMFIGRAHDVLVEVRHAADVVTAASHHVSATTVELSDSTQDQAGGLQETASSLEQITVTVRQNADNARQADQLANGTRTIAETGGDVVRQAVVAIDEINRSSKRIADIITAIDEIAFQTNLLALNAAVEAARAGEQGRGFAVVAAEVRSLAQRSAAAAREIKELIQDSVAKVDVGSRLVHRSGDTLDEIVTSVKRVTDIVGEIAAASTEQSSGIDQVNRAVTQMDRVTQANAAQTEELSSTAQALAGQAQQLQALVASFKLDAVALAGRTREIAAHPAPVARRRRPAAPRGHAVDEQQAVPAATNLS
jgi:methyl-accepting chemotaxis protein